MQSNTSFKKKTPKTKTRKTKTRKLRSENEDLKTKTP